MIMIHYKKHNRYPQTSSIFVVLVLPQLQPPGSNWLFQQQHWECRQVYSCLGSLSGNKQYSS